MIGAAGGGGAAAAGAATGGTLAVMVGTGVAAMTGVWDTAGGTLWNGAGGDTEDTATACCAPLEREGKRKALLGKDRERTGSKLVLLDWACSLSQAEHKGHSVICSVLLHPGYNRSEESLI